MTTQTTVSAAAAAAAKTAAETKPEVKPEVKAKTEVEALVEEGARAITAKDNTIIAAAHATELDIKGSGFTQTVAVTVDHTQCPPTHVCMYMAKDARVALTTGRCYIFAKDKPQFVHKEDRDAVAASGAGDYVHKD